MSEIIIEAVKSLLRERGYKSMAEFAESIDKSPNSFFNSLKYFAQNQGYKTKFALDLFEALQMNEDEFKLYLAQPRQNRDTRYLRIIDQMAEGYQNPHSGRESVNRLLDALMAGDRVILSTSMNPPEFTSPSRQRAISQAIERGVRFAYIYPQTEHKETGDVFERYVGQFSTEWKNIKESHQGFVQEMAASFSPSDQALRDAYFAASADDRTAAMYGMLPAHYGKPDIFIQPFHSYMVIQVKHRSGFENFVLESAMAAMPGSEENDYSQHWYPLPFYVGNRIANRVELVINAYPAEMHPLTLKMMEIAGSTDLPS